MTEDNQRSVRHPIIPVEAPAYVWKSAGFTVYENSDTVGQPAGYDTDINPLIVVGMQKHPGDGTAAVVWAIEERQRIREEKTRATAQAREADAISKLSAAIKESTGETVLRELLSRLTERTQYAVRQQLGKR